jgi:hypothetical protein
MLDNGPEYANKSVSQGAGVAKLQETVWAAEGKKGMGGGVVR